MKVCFAVFAIVILFTTAVVNADDSSNTVPDVFNVIQHKQSDITARKQLDQLVEKMEQQQQLAAFKIHQISKNVEDFAELELLQSQFMQFGLLGRSWIQPLPANVANPPASSAPVIVQNTESRLIQSLAQTQALAVSTWDKTKLKVVSLLGL